MTCALVALCLPLASVAQATVPTNFVDELVAGGFQTPTDVEIAADGRIFVAEKRGRIRVIDGGVLLPTAFIDLTDEVGNNADRGLMSIALHPDFVNNGYIYLLYVVDQIFGQPDESSNTVMFSRLTRYTALGNVADLPSRTVLIGVNAADGFPSCYNTHAAGTVAFGNDGNLFISAGDGSHADFVDDGSNVASYDSDCEALFGASQDIGALRAQSDLSMDGKVIRIDPDTGLGLPDNPHYDGDPNSFTSRIWTRGFRNPFRMTVKPGSPGQGTIYIGDVGLSTWEEISVATAASALLGDKNHGWPCYEATSPNTTYQLNPLIGPVCQALDPGDLTFPLISWHHSEPGAAGFIGSAATALGFYQGTSYPTEYWDALFFGDFVGDWIKVALVDANDNLVGVQDFASGIESPVDIEFEPGSDSMLYVSIINGEVRRIRYTLDNLAPQVQASAVPQGGSAPLMVTFSSDGTTDPDLDPVTLEWDFGDGSAVSTLANPVHSYDTVGAFTATLTATDDQMNAGSATVDITTANEPPTVSIDFPTDFYAFTDGEQIQLAATANDLEDPGGLTYAWDIRLVHNSHEHPEHFTSTQAVPPVTTLDNHGIFDDRFSYIVTLTVTDSVGLTAIDEVRVVPFNAPANQAPVAAFTATPADGDVPLLVNFDGGISTDPDVDLLDYHWNFGDGTSSSDAITSHIYSLPGMYTVTLTVTDVLGLTSMISQAVLVRLPGLVALYDFSEGAGTTIFDTSGIGTPLDLTIEDPGNTTWLPGGGLSLDSPTVLRSSTPALKIHDAAIAAEELSLEVWVEAANLTQVGPARIMAMSNDPMTAGGNFALTQEADTWEGRVRTTVTDDFGIPSLMLPPGAATTTLTHLVYTRDTAGATSVYVDGVRQGIATARGLLSNWSNGYELVLGNEPSTDRPWLGTLHKAAIYARALDEVEVAQSFLAGPGLAPTVPLVVVDPVDQLATAGSSVTLTVVAIGVGPISYQWQRFDGFAWVDESGATSESYITPILSVLDDGALYRAEISNPLGTTLSSTASVQVVTSFVAAIHVDAGPAVHSVTVGADVIIPVTITNTGTVDLEVVAFHSSDCDVLSGPLGDNNLDNRIQVTEVWTYDCTVSNVMFQQVVPLSIDAEALDGTPASGNDVVVIEVIGAPARVSSGLTVLYEFSAGTGDTVFDTSGVGTAFDLTIATPANASWPLGGGLSFDLPTVLTQAGPATKILDALQLTDAITLEAWIRPANTIQNGPARIIALTADPFPTGGNFILGQTADQFDARLRTTATNSFGTPGLASATGSAVSDQLTHLVYSRDAAGNEAFYVDGVLTDSGLRTGTFASWGAYEFAVANEPTVDRPWLGTFHLLAIYDTALSLGDVADNFQAGLSAPSLCGNSIQEVGEDCDEGGVSTLTCDADCTAPACGDGLYNAFVEQCEVDGDCAGGDICDGSCMCIAPPMCGNAVSEFGEDCDDGGASASCDADCTFASCGDGTFNPLAESCEVDGDCIGGQVCDGACACVAAPVCGNGTTEFGEDCDDSGESATCDSDCSFVACGDLTLNTAAGEQCEVNGDCSAGEACSSCACAPGSADFADDFDRASLGGNWLIQSGGYSISGNSLAEDFGVAFFTSRMTWIDATTTVDQFSKLELVNPGTDTFGFLFRFGDASGHYEVGLPPGTNEWRWEAYTPALGFVERVDDCLGDTAFSNGDVIGAQIESTGTDTVVSVWRWDSDPNPGAGYDAVTWGAPDCVMSGDPTTPLDNGNSLGLRAHTGSNTAAATADNWHAGDIPLASVCGNGITEGSEECDDSGESASCDADCTFATCGDGIFNAQAESCEVDGDCTGSDICDVSCACIAPPMCGNGVLEIGEECDDGVQTASCDADCTFPACGDLFFNLLAESCEINANCIDAKICDVSCNCVVPPVCGNGIPETGEDCDDSGASMTCDADCTFAACGDGVFNPLAESCEIDGDCLGGEICTGSCLCIIAPVCGNGVTEFGEDCDDSGESATCDADCSDAICGDFVVNVSAGEQCEVNAECSANELCTACGCVPRGVAFFDDFDRASLGANWTIEGGSFSIASNSLLEDFGVAFFTSRMSWVDDTLTTDQYSKLVLVDPNTDTFGFMLRFGDPSGHYEIGLPPGTTEWRWEAYTPALAFVERVDDCLGDAVISNGDVVGAKIEGSGANTVVSVWRWDSDPNPGAGYDVSLWGTPDCVMSADPTTALDSGMGVGVRAHAGSNTAQATAENWQAGDLPLPSVCGDGILSGVEQCEIDADCGTQLVYNMTLSVVDGAYPGSGAPGCSGAGDIDGDGMIDVVSAGGGVLQWYKAPAFTRYSIDAGVGAGPGANGIVVMDVDGDLDLDVVTGLFAAGIAWWENPGNGVAAQSIWVRRVFDGAVSGFLHDLAIGDIDGDLNDEIVALYTQGGGIYWYDIPANPTVDPWPRTQVLSTIDSPFTGLALGDIDDDGQLDIVAANSWYEQPADPTTPDWTARLIFAAPVQNIFLEDVDADGNLDVVATEGMQSPGRVLWSKAPNDPLTQAWTETVVAINLDRPENAWAGDIDGDTDVDIVTGELAGDNGFGDDDSNLLLFENLTGDGSSWNQVTLAENIGISTRIAPVDFDGDGDVDFTADGNSEDHIYLWVNGIVPAGVAQACDVGACMCIEALPECNNGIDDDGDLLIDFPADPDCSDLNDPTEIPEPSATLGLVAGCVVLNWMRRRRESRSRP